MVVTKGTIRQTLRKEPPVLIMQDALPLFKSWLMERKWWSDHRNPLAARVPETAAVERQDPVRGGLRS
jgi:hypothetical protein